MSITQAGTILGSPQYMSPEHARGAHDVTVQSDIDAEKFRSEIQASLNRGRDGIHRPVRVPAEIDAHIEANDPPVTLAVLGYVRELERAIQILAREVGSDFYQRQVDQLIEQGADTDATEVRLNGEDGPTTEASP